MTEARFVLVAVLLGGVAGVAGARLLYEGLFPRALWLNGTPPVAFLGLLGAVAGLFLWRRWGRRAVLLLLPLLITVPGLFDPGVDLLRSRLYFYTAAWLVVVAATHLIWPAAAPRRSSAAPRRGQTADLLLLAALVLPLYLGTMGRTVGEADTFEFQVVIPRLGIVHPTGYPLYLLLGRLFSLLPAGPVALRINLASVTFAFLALALLYLFVIRLGGHRLPALLAAVLLATRPTFWRQALEAEVYSLHALFVAGSLLLMLHLLDATTPRRRRSRLLLLAFWLGLGLTNHLTTVFLLPGAALAALLAAQNGRGTQPWSFAALANTFAGARSLVLALAAFLAPLSLYLYLPLRWPAVNSGEAMGWSRFLDWVVGGRFQDALQWQAFLRDPTRYEVVGRLFTAEWGDGRWLVPVLLFAAVLWLLQRRVALLLTITWAGYTFYCLNYYVPDLDVFLLPAQLVLAAAFGGGVGLLLSAERRQRIGLPAHVALLSGSCLLLVAVLWGVPTTWQAVDRSERDGGLTWGRAVLAQPLPENSLILADSEKIAPLYYLQQAEGVRPDLDIAVLFTEDEYRARLGAALRDGQPVFLARFLPGLEGQFHLRSAGPLTAVDLLPLPALPGGIPPVDLAFGPVTLRGFQVVAASAYDPDAAALTLYWEATAAVSDDWRVYVRWADADGTPLAGMPAPVGRHPANDYYPFRAWDPGEVVVDFHLLDRPVLATPADLDLQVALGPPFSAAADLPWQRVATVAAPATADRTLDRAVRLQVGDLLIDGVTLPETIRPGTPLPVLLSGCGAAPQDLTLRLQPPPTDELGKAPPAAVAPGGADAPDGAVASDEACADRFVRGVAVPTLDTAGVALGSGDYEVVVQGGTTGARCGWLQGATAGCVLGTVLVSGVPLPAGAVNFDDQIALLSLDAPDRVLTPGGLLSFTATWTGLAPLDENYTVFAQVLDAEDRIVGQVDSWPLQGTFPTAAWLPGVQIVDPYQIRLDADLPPGDYRLIVGLYLLGNPPMRLPVLDAAGSPLDDRVLLTGFLVP